MTAIKRTERVPVTTVEEREVVVGVEAPAWLKRYEHRTCNFGSRWGFEDLYRGSTLLLSGRGDVLEMEISMDPEDLRQFCEELAVRNKGQSRRYRLRLEEVDTSSPEP